MEDKDYDNGVEVFLIQRDRYLNSPRTEAWKYYVQGYYRGIKELFSFNNENFNQERFQKLCGTHENGLPVEESRLYEPRVMGTVESIDDNGIAIINLET